MPATHHCMCCHKNGFCSKHQQRCIFYPKVIFYKDGQLGNPKDAKSANEGSNDGEAVNPDDRQLIASGGYNDVWLVNRSIGDVQRYVLRKPKEDCLLPDQARNEVACLNYIRKNLPNIPVPRVHDYHVNGVSAEHVFVAEDYIEGERLSDVWSTYDKVTKFDLARQLAEIIVELGETNFDDIGGLMLDGTLGPTVEGMKLFKGRVSISCLTFSIRLSKTPN